VPRAGPRADASSGATAAYPRLTPAAVDAYESWSGVLGVDVVFGSALRICVARERGCLCGALTLNADIRAPTVAVVDRLPEFACIPIGTVHHVHFVLEHGQDGSLAAPIFSH
jgi:hypothetical protein